MKRIIIILLFLHVALFANENMQEQIEALDRKNKELFAEVKVFIDELIAEEKQALNEMNLDDDSSIQELQKGLEKAYDIAKLYGMDVTRLQKLYELSKKVILSTDFIQADSPQAISTANSFEQWFDFTGKTHAKLQEAKAKAQAQRVAFYKKVTLQYIKALSQKDPQKAYSGLKKYVDALRDIQAADADHLIAQAEALVAEQKLIADVSAGIPGVGEAIDIIAIVSGEDMSGQKLSMLERGLNLTLLLAPEALSQAIKRNPAVAKAIGKLSASINAMPNKAYTKLAKKIQSKAALKKHLARLEAPSKEIKKWREFYWQKLDEYKKLAKLPEATKHKIAKESEASIKEAFTRKNPLGEELGGKIAQTAMKRDEIIITRPTSEALLQRLDEGAYTKGMNVKGKSASEGIAKGYVPKNQRFSKLSDAEEVAKFQKKVDESLSQEKVLVDGAEYTITPQRVSSKQLMVKKDNMLLEAVELPAKEAGGNSVAVYKTPEGKILDENFQALSEEVLKQYDMQNAKTFEVLTDMDGNYLTADIDLLAVGSKKRATIMQNDELMGNINSHEMATVDEMNKALKSEKYPDRKLVHHGGENSFINAESTLDFPLSAYSPDGKVAVIKSEKELKRYFHTQKLRGYDLQPNPAWGWGVYDPQKGYK